MTNLIELLQGQLSPMVIQQLSEQLGGVDTQKTEAAASGIMTTLVDALARNAATEEGASSLANALERDHDGSILNDIMGILSGQTTVNNGKTLNGSGILSHILGNKQGNIASLLGQLSGLDSQKTANLMRMLAPIVLGVIGQQKRQQNLNTGGLMDLLNNNRQITQTRTQQNPAMGLIGKFLDADGDGSIMDDITGMVGRSLLKNLFR